MTSDFLIGAVRASNDLHPLVQTELEEILRRNEPAEAEMEGGSLTWWFVCGECHTAIDAKDKFCRECGKRVKWS